MDWQQQQQQAGFITGSPLPTADERLWGAIAHGSVLLSTFFGPLIVLALKGSGSGWVERQAKESLNFQITVFCAGIVLSVVGTALSCLGIGLLLLLLLIPLGCAAVVLPIYAAIKANEGVMFQYPVTVRLVK